MGDGVFEEMPFKHQVGMQGGKWQVQYTWEHEVPGGSGAEGAHEVHADDGVTKAGARVRMPYPGGHFSCSKLWAALEDLLTSMTRLRL